MKFYRNLVIVLFTALMLFTTTNAEENKTVFKDYLVFGPINVALPALSDEGDSDFGYDDLL